MGAPDIPAPPPAPPPAPDQTDAQVRAAALAARRKQMMQSGTRQSFLTGPRGPVGQPPAVGAKSLLGQ